MSAGDTRPEFSHLDYDPGTGEDEARMRESVLRARNGERRPEEHGPSGAPGRAGISEK